MNADARSEILDRIQSADVEAKESEANIPDEFTITFKRASSFPEEGAENDKGWVVSVPELPGTFSQGETLEEAAVMAVDALKLVVDE